MRVNESPRSELTCAEVDALRKRIADLEKALDPFSQAADEWAHITPEAEAETYVDHDANISVRDLRVARAARNGWRPAKTHTEGGQ